MVDLNKFFDDQMAIAANLPEKVKGTFDLDDLPLTQALDITVSIKKSLDFLEEILSGVEQNKLDESSVRMLKTLRSIWEQMYLLAQVGTDRIMTNDAAKPASSTAPRIASCA